MSEHIQQAPGPHSSPSTAEAHESTPGVSRESEWFNFWLIVKVGVGLALTAAVIQVAVWYLLHGLEKIETQPVGTESSLALDDARRPLGQRLENVPPPLLEGIERESSQLILGVEEDKEERFYVASDVKVHLGAKENARLFELREGQRVTVAYHLPGGVAGGIGVVTSVTSPPVKSDTKTQPELPDATRTLTATVVRLVPRGIASSREWAEVQMERSGWIDPGKEIVHVSIEQAMEDVLKSKEFRSEDGKKKSAGRTPMPTPSNSGREPRGGGR